MLSKPTLNSLKPIGTVGIMWDKHPARGFMDSLAQMLLYSQRTLCGPGEFIHYSPEPTYSWHEGARNQLVEAALGEWLLQLDTDHNFQPDLLSRMLRLKAKHKSRVLSGLYMNKNPPHFPVATVWTDAQGNFTQLTKWDRKAEIYKNIGPTGGGCLLVDNSVYLEIANKFHEAPFRNIAGLSEDYSFAVRCQKLGIRLDLALQIQSHHYKAEPPTIYSSDFPEVT